MTRCIRIERTELRPGKTELDEAYLRRRGYVLAAPHFSSKERKQPGNATHVATLDDAADLIEKHGYHIRMGNRPYYPSMIEPAKVRIIRV
jgi:hypothetical protein